MPYDLSLHRGRLVSSTLDLDRLQSLSKDSYLRGLVKSLFIGDDSLQLDFYMIAAIQSMAPGTPDPPSEEQNSCPRYREYTSFEAH